MAGGVVELSELLHQVASVVRLLSGHSNLLAHVLDTFSAGGRVLTIRQCWAAVRLGMQEGKKQGQHQEYLHDAASADTLGVLYSWIF